MYKKQINWPEKSLESLDNCTWKSDPEETSYLVRTCQALRKKRLSEFEVEDLRVMIGQGIGLKYLIPMAIEVLSENILAEGHHYEGDLLMMVLKSDPAYWKAERANWILVCEIYQVNENRLMEFDTIWSIKKEWKSSFSSFKQLLGNP